MVVNYPVAPMHIVLLHGSAVEFATGAWVFLGPSGTGKSTICSLLREFTNKIADDLVYLNQDDCNGKWRVSNAYDNCNNSIFSPGDIKPQDGQYLLAIVRLYQAREPHIQQVDVTTTLEYLSHAYFETPWNLAGSIEKRRTDFSTLASIARDTLAYKLRFTKHSDTVDLLGKFIA
jgi:ABC-type multidrug transport system ATPase subunit